MFQAILFDLDNTLYSEQCGVFDLIDKRMNEWLMSRLQLSVDKVDEFRHQYFVRYGTTLRGLMLHHDVDPHDFLHYVHDVPVKDFLGADQELRESLESISTRKIIFTNSDSRHAHRILDALGINDLFEKIFDIEEMKFIPKPNPEPYEAVLRYLQAPASSCLLIDDMDRNLKPAKALGMQTILIGAGEPVEGCDYAIRNIKELNGVLQQIAAAS
jgi:putative hydrolase of the HAD superfamily